MKISVFGCGYVGLTAAVCFAELGHEVIGVDILPERVSTLQEGRVPFYEPGLEGFLRASIDSRRLRFTTNFIEAIQESEVIICAVGTALLEDNSADLQAVLQVAEQFALHGRAGQFFVNKSTIPLGANESIYQRIQELQQESFDFQYVYNPEFLREGSAVQDFLEPERIVIGSRNDNDIILSFVHGLYAVILKKNVPVIFTTHTNAELIKYAANSFLALKVSFANELAEICEHYDGDIQRVVEGLSFDPRIGGYLQPGLGFGGSCLPKDLRALVNDCDKKNIPAPLLRAVQVVNDSLPEKVLQAFQNEFNELRGVSIGVWGVAFKANTDDVRDTPLGPIMKKLVNAGVEVTVYDPLALPNFRKIWGDRIRYAENALDAVRDQNALLVGTAAEEFLAMDLRQVLALMKGNLLVDGRNIFTPAYAKECGFIYRGMGRN